jgi:pyridoxal phosphate enzyme (YggS family)
MPETQAQIMEDNIKQVLTEISETAIRSGREPGGIRLMAVSKFQPAASIAAALGCGITLFGESRPKEACEKFGTNSNTGRLFPSAELHLIGSLQTNKAKLAVQTFDCIQSLDRLPLIETLGKLTAGRTAHPLNVLLEINSGEEQKSGFRDNHNEELMIAVEKLIWQKGLLCQGLMTMAPNTNDEKILRACFSNLRRKQEILSKAFPQCSFGVLSMGMSGDFKYAIEEGSTLVRIGTRIFGGRVM